MLRGTGSRLDKEMILYVHRVLNGHPGVAKGLLESLLDHPVIQPTQIFLSR
jgi:hypothetical protein